MHFLDVVTLKDVTADEMRYIVGNILLTSRYGAVSSRVGRMENQILGIFGGIAELPSSLELVQSVHDAFTASGKALEHPFESQAIADVTKQVISGWTNKRGVSVKLSDAEVSELIADVDRHWSEDERATFLKRLDSSYETFRKVPEEKKAKGKGKAKDTEAGG